MNLEEVDRYYHKAMETFKVELDKIKISDIRTLKAVVSTYDSVLGQLGSWFESIDTYKNNKQDNELAILTITIKHERDGSTCKITDIALLRDNLVLLADYGNSKLRIFDTGNSTLVSNAKLQYTPWQMSVTEHGEAYVAYYGQPKILHLKSPATDLTTFREINVNGQCFAVECFNQTLKVQCVSPAKSIEVDEDGKQVRVINNDLSKETTENGEQFVTNPLWSTQDPATGSMYVSCISTHSITEIKSDGNVELFLKADKLNTPYGLCMDIDGSIIVCSYSSKDVFRVKRNGDIQSVLPQPLDFNPCTVAFDKRTRKLYVGGQSDTIYVFQI
ncbi:uncharacterized protein LOC128216374 [Mya arenaria]|uniref:uncharacterized protein LOC128216374 n=1 Tax=Mya arenaria TaxID=6604 RepID=UPI0022E47D0B|nr:uncharacterized protein LOC128216374 [Mya arenaria]